MSRTLAGLLQVLQDVSEAVIDARAVGHARQGLPIAFEFLSTVPI